MQKIFYKLCLGLGIVGLMSCSGNSYWTNEEDVMVSGEEVVVYPQVENNTMFMSDPLNDAKVFNKRVPDLNSLLVCRDKQCAPAEMSTAKQYVLMHWLIWLITMRILQLCYVRQILKLMFVLILI